jgi:transcriptional regulator with XRE-family HTH domain
VVRRTRHGDYGGAIVKGKPASPRTFPLPDTVGWRLKQMRIARGYTIRQMATLMDVSDSTITAYENRRVLPEAPSLVKLAQVLHTSIDYILGVSPKPPTVAAVYQRGNSFDKVMQIVQILPDADGSLRVWVT